MEMIVGAALAIGGTVAGWFVKGFFPSYLSEKGKNLATKEDVTEITKKVEAARLEYIAEAERIRAELHGALQEQHIRYARLHERRFDAIDGLYKRLVRAQRDFGPLVGGLASDNDPDFQERLDTAGEAGRELLRFFADHRLYYPKELIRAFGALEQVLAGAWATFAFERREDDWSLVPRHERERQVAVWKEARDAVRKRVPELLERVEDTMRRILGDIPSPPVIESGGPVHDRVGPPTADQPGERLLPPEDERGVPRGVG